MNPSVPMEMIRVIRAERYTRCQRLAAEDPDLAYDQWLFTDEPFVNELCLMLLVAIRHHIERELVWLAARATSDGRELDGEQYRQRVQNERKHLRRKNGWKRLVDKLQLKNVAEWNSSMETLRLLANAYKHDPSSTPDHGLLKHLELDLGKNYAPLGESRTLIEALAVSLDLQDADCCDIAEELLARAGRFLAEVERQERQTALSPVRRGLVSMDPRTFLQ